MRPGGGLSLGRGVKAVLYRDAVATGCGNASSAVGVSPDSL
jgi:predicted metalloprotease